MKRLFLSLFSFLLPFTSQANIDKNRPVYKVLRHSEWQIFQSTGQFAGSEHDQRDGFIHLSPQSQVERIIKKYFSDSRPIYVVKFSAPNFLKNLTWEPASSGELYPHLYDAVLLLDQMDSYHVVQDF